MSSIGLRLLLVFLRIVLGQEHTDTMSHMHPQPCQNCAENANNQSSLITIEGIAQGFDPFMFSADFSDGSWSNGSQSNPLTSACPYCHGTGDITGKGSSLHSQPNNLDQNPQRLPGHTDSWNHQESLHAHHYQQPQNPNQDIFVFTLPDQDFQMMQGENQMNNATTGATQNHTESQRPKNGNMKDETSSDSNSSKSGMNGPPSTIKRKNGCSNMAIKMLSLCSLVPLVALIV